MNKWKSATMMQVAQSGALPIYVTSALGAAGLELAHLLHDRLGVGGVDQQLGFARMHVKKV